MPDHPRKRQENLIFIDDSDAIFESGGELGFYRYLLTRLDGLESEGAGRVCVILTAMDVANLPPALVRSGRIELWLEMTLPDADARREILRDLVAARGTALDGIDIEPIAEATDKLTGADLKRVVDDATAMLAWHEARGGIRPDRIRVFLEAVSAIKRDQEKYATAAQHARKQRASRPPIYGVGFDDS